MPDLSDQIEQAAIDPSSVTVDGQIVVDKSVAERILADKYLAEKAAADLANSQGGKRSGWGGMRAAQAVLPGGI